MLFFWLFLQESCLNLAIVYSVSLLLQVELLLKHQVDSLFAHSKLSIDKIFFPKMQWTKPSSFEHADRGNFHIHSLVCMEFSILVIVWEYEVFQTVHCTVRVVFYHFYMFVIIIISLFVHRLFCYAICSSRYDCSFFYLQQYFSSSSYLTLLGSVLCFVHSAVRCPLLLLQFFGYCCWIPTSFNLTNSPFRSFHTARFFTHSVLYAKCEYIVFIA